MFTGVCKKYSGKTTKKRGQPKGWEARTEPHWHCTKKRGIFGIKFEVKKTKPRKLLWKDRNLLRWLTLNTQYKDNPCSKESHENNAKLKWKGLEAVMCKWRLPTCLDLGVSGMSFCLSVLAMPDSGVSGEVAPEPSSTTWSWDCLTNIPWLSSQVK